MLYNYRYSSYDKTIDQNDQFPMKNALKRAYKKDNRNLECSTSLNVQHREIIISQFETPCRLLNATVIVKFEENSSKIVGNLVKIF